MTNLHSKLKGIHPGVILARELKNRHIKQRPFALSIGEHPQTFNAIIKGKRGLNTLTALKIERALNLEEGYLVLFQTYHDISKEKLKLNSSIQDATVLKDRINPSLFWDTDFNKIDWIKQYIPVIRRVFDRGNKQDRNEIIQFYGESTVQTVLREHSPDEPYTLYQNHATLSNSNSSAQEMLAGDNE